jgi:V-type H+-transporting ATPase subunit H
LEAVTNMLKAEHLRAMVWAHHGVADRIFAVQKTANSSLVYRSVFAIWMLSFDKTTSAALKSRKAIKHIKDILSVSRVEKVVRLCLTVLRNFLADKSLCEEIVEEGTLEVVQQLEYEKWRDAELYDDIRDVSAKIALEVSNLSNYDRYERELATGKLSWGFIHSSKFWAENVLKFETNDFRSLKLLAGLIQGSNTDPTTLAVACHDIGEFVSLHPSGKKKIAQLKVKERVMELMGSTDPAHREVRREALLCCQKIMLNKWQDIQTEKK